MRTWRHARTTIPCGSCRALIRGPRGTLPGDVMLEWTKHDVKLARCRPCAVRMFREQPPADIPDGRLAFPVPTLPIEPMRNTDFVTPRQLALHNQYADYRRRQAGESE